MKKIISLLYLLIFTLLGITHWFDLKMSDCIAPFFEQEKEIQHYSNIPFYQLDIDKEPYVNLNQLSRIETRYIEYIKKVKKAWYNAISLDDINHLLLFEKIWIYKNTNYEKRNNIYKEFYTKLIKYANEEWLDVYIISDMQFYTQPMIEYLWKIDKYNKDIEVLNQIAIEEILTNYNIKWIIIRVWEWWKAYNNQFYKSKVLLKDEKDVNKMINSILPIFEKYNKTLILRTWTIWIGNVWDFITNTETYDKVFEWIESDNIIASIKFTPWDFFYYEVYNPIIWHWNIKQIIEFQVRREYDWWWDFPNFIWFEFKELLEYLKKQENVIWFWNWNQTWWWWFWHNIIYNFGFNLWNEINFEVVGDIINNNDVNIKDSLITTLKNKWFNNEQIKVLENIMLESREVVKNWWYHKQFVEKNYKIYKNISSSLLRIWWDQITTSPIVLSIIYFNISDHWKALKNSRDAIWKIWVRKEKRKKVKWDNTLDNNIMLSLENQYRIFEILTLFKETFFDYFKNWEKTNKKEIYKKINEYNNFVSETENFNFDFYEIRNFYSIWKSEIKAFHAVIHIIVVIIFFLSIKYYNQLIHKFKNIRFWNKIFLWIFVLIIAYLILSPHLFIWKYNFYWFLSKLNITMLIITWIYFFIITYFLNKFFNQEIYNKFTIKNILKLTIPIIISLEAVLLLSFIFGEHIFWKLIWAIIVSDITMISTILILLNYIIILLIFWSTIFWINEISMKRRYKKYFYFLLLLWLLVFIVLIYFLDYKNLLLFELFENLYPNYFDTAWSDLKEFLK